MPLFKTIINVTGALAFIAAGSFASAQSRSGPMIAATPDKGAVLATADRIPNLDPSVPGDLAERMQRGGLVFVHRYTGSGGGGPDQPSPEGAIDDGQRISADSVEKMAALGDVYRNLGVPVDRVYSSQYFFVYQHAQAAMGEDVTISRDLTGSLDFSDPAELAQSNQQLRNRLVTPPPAGSNTVLFTHQGKFSKAMGYWLPAGQTLIFQPDGSGQPNLIANLAYDGFIAPAR